MIFFKKSAYTFLVFSLLLAISACETVEPKPLSLSPLFADHMVLQQSQSVAIWGEYTPGQKVAISGSWGTDSEAQADENGHWQVNLNTPEAGGPYELTIKAGETSVNLKDVMIGEVWLASGQSNMEMPLRGWPPNDPIQNSAEEIANATYPDIRMITVQRALSMVPVDSIIGTWKVTSPEAARNFSATAYFFARRLHQELNVPIGIIHSSWGGTPAESWTSKAKLKTLGDFDEALAPLEGPDGFKTTTDWFAQWEKIALPQTEVDWDNISFNGQQATQEDYDDSSWDEITLPGRFDVFANGQIDGAVWFRKKFAVEDPDSDHILTIGAVDDMDATYINEHKVGGMAGPGYHNVKRQYQVPAGLLKEGENTITIRAIDTGGPGVIAGPISLTKKSGSSTSLEGTWKYRPVAEIYQGSFYAYSLDEQGFSARPEIQQLTSHTPSVLYNAMIAPLLPYSIKGAIWYQGESNVGRAEQYERLFPAMITDWREKWGSNFPFYFVQIAPFRYHSGPVTDDLSQKLRDAQRKTLSLENTGMVVTMDIGNYTNIHPANKQDVGHRLAGLAMANDYGKRITASGPLYKSHSVAGNKLIVQFDHARAGLVAKDGKPEGFEIAGADGRFVPASARIVDDHIEVSSSSVPNPQHVRYAWSDRGAASLFNREGLPASSFSSRD